MGSIAYTARRKLTGGVTLGQLVSRDLGFGEATPSHNFQGARNTSLSGQQETVLQRVDSAWSVTTAYHTAAERAELVMFIHSALGGEPFDIDFEGSIASPDVVRTVKMDAQSVTEARIGKDLFRFSFTVLEV